MGMHIVGIHIYIDVSVVVVSVLHLVYTASFDLNLHTLREMAFQFHKECHIVP